MQLNHVGTQCLGHSLCFVRGLVDQHGYRSGAHAVHQRVGGSRLDAARESRGHYDAQKVGALLVRHDDVFPAPEAADLHERGLTHGHAPRGRPGTTPRPPPRGLQP